jgi:hypothetical protein
MTGVKEARTEAENRPRLHRRCDNRNIWRYCHTPPIVLTCSVHSNRQQTLGRKTFRADNELKTFYVTVARRATKKGKYFWEGNNKAAGPVSTVNRCAEGISRKIGISV